MTTYSDAMTTTDTSGQYRTSVTTSTAGDIKRSNSNGNIAAEKRWIEGIARSLWTKCRTDPFPPPSSSPSSTSTLINNTLSQLEPLLKAIRACCPSSSSKRAGANPSTDRSSNNGSRLLSLPFGANLPTLASLKTNDDRTPFQSDIYALWKISPPNGSSSTTATNDNKQLQRRSCLLVGRLTDTNTAAGERLKLMDQSGQIPCYIINASPHLMDRIAVYWNWSFIISSPEAPTQERPFLEIDATNAVVLSHDDGAPLRTLIHNQFLYPIWPPLCCAPIELSPTSIANLHRVHRSHRHRSRRRSSMSTNGGSVMDTPITTTINESASDTQRPTITGRCIHMVGQIRTLSPVIDDPLSFFIELIAIDIHDDATTLSQIACESPLAAGGRSHISSQQRYGAWLMFSGKRALRWYHTLSVGICYLFTHLSPVVVFSRQPHQRTVFLSTPLGGAADNMTSSSSSSKQYNVHTCNCKGSILGTMVYSATTHHLPSPAIVVSGDSSTSTLSQSLSSLLSPRTPAPPPRRTTTTTTATATTTLTPVTTSSLSQHPITPAAVPPTPQSPMPIASLCDILTQPITKPLIAISTPSRSSSSSSSSSSLLPLPLMAPSPAIGSVQQTDELVSYEGILTRQVTFGVWELDGDTTRPAISQTTNVTKKKPRDAIRLYLSRYSTPSLFDGIGFRVGARVMLKDVHVVTCGGRFKGFGCCMASHVRITALSTHMKSGLPFHRAGQISLCDVYRRLSFPDVALFTELWDSLKRIKFGKYIRTEQLLGITKTFTMDDNSNNNNNGTNKPDSKEVASPSSSSSSPSSSAKEAIQVPQVRSIIIEGLVLRLLGDSVSANCVVDLLPQMFDHHQCTLAIQRALPIILPTADHDDAFLSQYTVPAARSLPQRAPFLPTLNEIIQTPVMTNVISELQQQVDNKSTTVTSSTLLSSSPSTRPNEWSYRTVRSSELFSATRSRMYLFYLKGHPTLPCLQVTDLSMSMDCHFMIPPSGHITNIHRRAINSIIELRSFTIVTETIASEPNSIRGSTTNVMNRSLTRSYIVADWDDVHVWQTLASPASTQQVPSIYEPIVPPSPLLPSAPSITVTTTSIESKGKLVMGPPERPTALAHRSRSMPSLQAPNSKATSSSSTLAPSPRIDLVLVLTHISPTSPGTVGQSFEYHCEAYFVIINDTITNTNDNTASSSSNKRKSSNTIQNEVNKRGKVETKSASNDVTTSSTSNHVDVKHGQFSFRAVHLAHYPLLRQGQIWQIHGI
jgi:hypothetical protein